MDRIVSKGCVKMFSDVKKGAFYFVFSDFSRRLTENQQDLHRGGLILPLKNHVLRRFGFIPLFILMLAGLSSVD